jgi:hypothetical protein
MDVLPSFIKVETETRMSGHPMMVLLPLLAARDGIHQYFYNFSIFFLNRF